MAFLDTKHKRKSFTLTTLLVSLLLLLLFYSKLTYQKPPVEKGIVIHWGTMDFGNGKVQLNEKIHSTLQKTAISPVKQSPPQKPKKENEQALPLEEALTHETEETIKINQHKEATRKAEEAAREAKAERVAREKRETEEKIRQEQEARKKKLDALIAGIGKPTGKTTVSKGNDPQIGDKGQTEGDPYATTHYSITENGQGTSGYGLNGRTLVKRGKVQQKCNEVGRVVVQIVVDRNGRVVEAIPGVKGTTNRVPCLLEPAKETALLHQWNVDAKAPLQQTGFVVVNFKLGQ